MITESDLSNIERRLMIADGQSWTLIDGEERSMFIEILGDDATYHLTITQDEWGSDASNFPATKANYSFIAHVPEDLRILVDAVRDPQIFPIEKTKAIAARIDAASPGPWKLWLESDGGLGGCNLIQPNNETTDLYLWWRTGVELAPDSYWELIAAARTDIPLLLQELAIRDV